MQVDRCPRALILCDFARNGKCKQRRDNIRVGRPGFTVAGQVYQKLKKLAPQSEEAIEARELIKAAVIKRK